MMLQVTRVNQDYGFLLGPKNLIEGKDVGIWSLAAAVLHFLRLGMPYGIVVLQ